MPLGMLSKATPSYRLQEVLNLNPYLVPGLCKNALRNLSLANSLVHY